MTEIQTPPAVASPGTPAKRSKLLKKFRDIVVNSVPDEAELVISAMKKGVQELLRLHTLPELKAICGGLNIPPGEDGEDCIKAILGYVNEEDSVIESRSAKMLTFSPEEAVFEYLRHLGVPVYSSFQDPKIALRRHWQMGSASLPPFTPQYIQQHAQNRVEWMASRHLNNTLRKIEEIEVLAKRAERELVEEGDYRAIQNYLHTNHRLRQLEAEFRRQVVGEIEMSTARAEHESTSAKLMTEQMSQLEREFEELGKRYLHEVPLLESQRRMHLQSYLELVAHVEDMTRRIRTATPLSYYRTPPQTQHVVEDFENAWDDYVEFSNQRHCVEELRHHLTQVRLNEAEQQIVQLQATLKLTQDELYATQRALHKAETETINGVRFTLQEGYDMYTKIRSIKSFAFAGLRNPDTQRFWRTFVNGVDLFTDEEMKPLRESKLMDIEDQLSHQYREFLKRPKTPDKRRFRRTGSSSWNAARPSSRGSTNSLATSPKSRGATPPKGARR